MAAEAPLIAQNVRNKNMKKIIIFIILIILAAYAGWVFDIVFISQNNSAQSTSFSISKGEGVHQISSDLKKAGLIANSFVFEAYIWFTHSSNKILAGDHVLNGTWSVRALVRELTTGSTLTNETTIKILEGWNLRDTANYLEKQGICTSAEFYDAAGRPGVNYDLNKDYKRPPDFSNGHAILDAKPKNYGYEGFLFPDTYRIFKDASARDIVEKTINNFERRVNKEMLAAISSSGRNLYDVITLASIIEKEEKTIEDKKMVAGIYYNRLRIGMALQADPTVNYITGNQDGGPSAQDLEIKNPYNTYKYKGLPPGPISNPALIQLWPQFIRPKAAIYTFTMRQMANFIWPRRLKNIIITYGFIINLPI